MAQARILPEHKEIYSVDDLGEVQRPSSLRPLLTAVTWLAFVISVATLVAEFRF